MIKKIGNKDLKVLAKRLQAASEPTRLQILCLIFGKEKVCVSEIAKKLKLSVAIVSHHLQALYKEGILNPEREGKRICYILAETDFVNDLKNLICKYK
ncbi:MAG: Regulatory protein ArsR [Candidatus Magasanikbacteria bacterium GW2011_GWC2_34_16]|uniref:Regulatory protein ArsR n=2 Tax=Candidatus Magasanikiibacteriota TaxID=1752731 RepID=A0A0G0JWB4_9BACT|nr:MAG: Regulatory protein ArsR [Candidatus Magasanikbacteria bacterium GW2011_GWC2_34_16]KKQ41134.1 MAG: Regulatory protein ArsR [Candidatus Magasanikbacteria bacterium GW2011_GWA2_37_8]